MEKSNMLHRVVAKALLGLGLVLVLALPAAMRASAASDAGDGDAPTVDRSASAQSLRALPRKPIASRIAVTIFEFRSGTPSIQALAATDMFTTALIDSGQFRVVERAQLGDTVMREKQMNAAGQTDGSTSQQRLRGAKYIFEGTVSEANSAETQKQGGVGIGGLNIGGGKSADTLAIDVRIIDAGSGDVLDSIAVRKTVKSSTTSIGGTAALANTVASFFHRSASPMTPDVNYQTSRKESIDRALRACINAAVLQLIDRLGAGEVSGR